MLAGDVELSRPEDVDEREDGLRRSPKCSLRQHTWCNSTLVCRSAHLRDAEDELGSLLRCEPHRRTSTQSFTNSSSMSLHCLFRRPALLGLINASRLSGIRKITTCTTTSAENNESPCVQDNRYSDAAPSTGPVIVSTELDDAVRNHDEASVNEILQTLREGQDLQLRQQGPTASSATMASMTM